MVMQTCQEAVNLTCHASVQKLVPEKKVFEVHIEPGHRNNSKVVLRGEAGCSDPDMQPGDVVFILEARPHKTFRRIASDLVYEKVQPFPTIILNIWAAFLFIPSNSAKPVFKRPEVGPQTAPHTGTSK